MMKRSLIGLLAGGLALAFVTPGVALAQDNWDGPVPVRVRHFEGGVTVQRVHANETGEALINLPLDVGDRLWTDSEGRAELVMGDGTLIWIAEGTTVDIVSLASAGRSGESLVRLWNGSMIVARRDGLDEVRVDAPEASVRFAADVLARVDVQEGRSWLSVYDGRAEIQAGGLVEYVTAGERSFAERGTAPAEPIVFNTAEQDGFDVWYAERIADLSRTVEHVRRERSYVPREVVHYAADLESNGNWFYYDEFDAWAWRPVVSVGWAPYRHGRWVYSYGGWSWVSHSRWGWATSHYGRWHHVPAYGWVWFPGRVYSPGWVSWHVGGGYVGWSPLGYYDRPLISINLWFGGHRGYGYGYHGRSRGYAQPRGRVVADRGYTRDPGDAWTFVRDGDLGRPDVGRSAVVDRTAVRRSSTGGSSVSLQGPLRPRDPRVLVAGTTTRTATPRLGAGSDGSVRTGSSTGPRVAVGRGDSERPTVIRPGVRGGESGSSGTAVVRPGTDRETPTVTPRGVERRPTVVPRPSTGSIAPRPRTALPRTSSGRPAILPRPSTGGAPSVPRPSGGISRPTILPRSGSGSSSTIMPRPSGGGSRTILPRTPTTIRRPTVTPRGSVSPPSSIGRPRGSSGPSITRRSPTRITPAPRSSSSLLRSSKARSGRRPTAPSRSSSRPPVRKAKPKPKPKSGGGS